MRTDDLDATFTALAHPARRAIIARLARGDAGVMELAAPFDMSQPAVSKHLKVLERARLISRARDGQRRPCRLEPARLREAQDWLQRYCDLMEARFQRLDDLLEELKSEQQKEKRNGRTKQRKAQGNPAV